MLIRFTPAGDAASLCRLVDEVAADPAIGLILVLTCDGNELESDELERTLSAASKPVVGGLFPYLVRDARMWSFGSIVVGLSCAAQAVTVSAGDDARAIEAQLRDASASARSGAVLVFADNQCEAIQQILDALASACGNEAHCIGAAAGSFTLVGKPCILTNQGLVENAAVVAFTDIDVGVGLAQGWHAISPTYEVTATAGKAVVALDGRPAFDVYREVVEAHSGRSFRHTAFSDFAMAYPLGMTMPDGGLLVRDPVVEDDGRLLCLGQAMPGSRMHVLHCSPETLTAATEHARQAAWTNYAGRQAPQAVMLLGCVSRALLLQDDFQRDLGLAHAQGEVPLFGALTLGEIARDGRGRPALHNKSLTIALLGT